MLNIIPAIKTGVQRYRVRVPLIGSAWADKYFYLSPESSGTEGRWKSYPYQIAILNWMTSDDIEELNFQKSRRIGYTKCLVAATACLIVEKNRNIAIWQPRDGDAKGFTMDEINPALRDVPVLGAKLQCNVGAKSKFNTVDKKVFHGAILDIKGGTSPQNFRRVTKDVAIYDELSAFDMDIDGEGSATELGDGRLDAAPFPKSIRGSTSKIKGLCQIETAVENSDMIFYRFVECPHCLTLQKLEFKNFQWEKDKPETVVYKCKSGCTLYYRDYPEMDEAGRWQTEEGFYYEDALDAFFGPDDKPIPKPRRIGARIWAGYSYLRPWSYFVDRWLLANKEAKNGNITQLKSVINTLLGETFQDKGMTVNATALGGRGEDYLKDGTIPNEVLVITAGGDVQGGVNARIELEFVGHGLESETWSLGYYVVPGDAERPEVWDHVDELLRKTFVRGDGVVLKVDAAFIDSGYLTHEVYRYTGPRRKRNIYATKGVSKGTFCNKGNWQGDKKKGGRAILRTMNEDDAKTIVFNRLRIEEPGPGYCHFPEHYTDQHFTQLTNEEKIEVRKKGVLVGYEWRKKGPNEQLDVRVYALGAFEFLHPNLGKIKMRFDRRVKDLEVAAELGIPISQRQAAGQANINQQQEKKSGKSKSNALPKKKGWFS